MHTSPGFSQRPSKVLNTAVSLQIALFPLPSAQGAALLRLKPNSGGWENQGNTIPGPEPSGLDTPFDPTPGMPLKETKGLLFFFFSKDVYLCADFFSSCIQFRLNFKENFHECDWGQT